MKVTSQTVWNRLEKIRKKMHNGEDAYADVVKLIDIVAKNGVNAAYIAAHCQFVADVLDGITVDKAYKKLNLKLKK
jgi:hypothetical protein